MKKTVIIFSIVLTLILTVASIAQYFTKISQITISLLVYLVPILILILAVYYYRRSNNGYSPFKDIFLLGTLIIAISFSLSTIISYGILMSLNEEQKLEVENNFIEQQLEMLEKMGTDKILAEQELEKVTMSIFDFKTQILGIVAIIPIFMIFCAIIALVMKKDEPEMVV